VIEEYHRRLKLGSLVLALSKIFVPHWNLSPAHVFYETLTGTVSKDGWGKWQLAKS
jgi:hypothetical protein